MTCSMHALREGCRWGLLRALCFSRPVYWGKEPCTLCSAWGPRTVVHYSARPVARALGELHTTPPSNQGNPERTTG